MCRHSLCERWLWAIKPVIIICFVFVLLYLARFADSIRLRNLLDNLKRPQSVFSQRTDESSASQYFQFYGYLSQQQNMMQDYVRTSTYQKAILGNLSDFKVSLDSRLSTLLFLFFCMRLFRAFDGQQKFKIFQSPKNILQKLQKKTLI